MNAEQWRLHDELRVAFAKILFAWQHPVMLGDPPEDESLRDERMRQMHHYFHNDVAAHHVLQSLVHAAVVSMKPSERGKK